MGIETTLFGDDTGELFDVSLDNLAMGPVTFVADFGPWKAGDVAQRVGKATP